MGKSSVYSLPVIKHSRGAHQATTDLVAVEEPLEIKVQFGPRRNREERTLAITMRTPGHDYELACGFLFTEGIIASAQDITDLRHCRPDDPESAENQLRVQLHPRVNVSWENFQRHVYISSSCGVCGKTSMKSVEAACPFPADLPGPLVHPELIKSLPTRLQERQLVFNRTGGLHAACLFDASGHPLLWREDVGRHNALDKVLGAACAQNWLPLTDHILLVSGRLSFELVQKAVMAGIKIMTAVGAPSSLAVQLAIKYNMTLVGFTSDSRFNIYHGQHRIVASQDHGT